MPLKVVNNYGMQGGTYNPQQTAPAQVLQPTYNPQPATYNPQRTAPASSIQYAPAPPIYRKSPQQLRVEAQRREQAAAQQRWLAAERVRIQREAEERARKKAYAETHKKKIEVKKGGFATMLNTKVGTWLASRLHKKLTVKRANEVAWDQGQANEAWAELIENEWERFQKEAAQRKDAIIQAGQGSDPAQWDKMVSEFENWYTKRDISLKSDMQRYQLEQVRLQKIAQRPIQGRVGDMFNKAGNVVSSLVSKPLHILGWTASQPSRAINTFKNVVNPNAIRTYGGGVEKTGSIRGGGWQETLKRAYNESKNQRIVGFTKATEQKWGKFKSPLGGFSMVNPQMALRYGDDYFDMLADPLSWFGARTVDRFYKGVGSKITKNNTFRKAAVNSAVFRQAVDNSAFGKITRPVTNAAKWLAHDKQSKTDKYFEVTKAANRSQRELQDKYREKLFNINKDLPKSQQFDFSILDDAAKLTDFDVQVLSRMQGGRLSRRDSLRFLGKGKQATRRFYEDFAQKWDAFTEKMRVADDVNFTRFGKGKGIYRPHTSWIEDLDDYDFRRFQKKGAMTADDFVRGATDRLFKSAAVGMDGFNRASKRGDIANEFRKAYEAELEPIKQGVQAAYKAAKNDPTRHLKYVNPMNLWRKSVLKYNPAWYINNVGWNLPASVSAGGYGSLAELAKWMTKGKGYRSEIMKTLPDGVKTSINKDIGKAGLATKIEDAFRISTFQALKKDGVDAKSAKRMVDRWMFDYTNKNIDRLPKTMFPFWKWQTGLWRLAATMPFVAPRAAKTFSEGYDKFYQEPYDKLPHEKQTYTDPDTGETVTYDPREMYKGKLKVGKNWYNTPSMPLNPETMMNIGVNPFFTTSTELARGKDRFNQPVGDRSTFQLFAEKFPQLRLSRDFVNRKKFGVKRWFSESFMGKWKQGQDKSATNYDPSLDTQRKFNRTRNSFLGIPNSVEFNENEFYTKKRLTDFNKEFFAIDWDKRLEELKAAAGDTQFGFDDPNSPYAKLKAEQAALASKHGFDIQKDIYDNYWSKYDTEITKNAKRQKEEAFKFGSDFWRDYLSLPEGSKTQASKRRPFLIEKYAQWAKDRTFAKNPFIDIPEFSEYDAAGNKTGVKKPKNPVLLRGEESSSQARRAAGAAKYQRKLAYEHGKRTGDWSWLNSLGGGKRGSGVQHDGKWFKTTASRDRYIAGRAKFERKLAYDRKDWAFFGKSTGAFTYKGKHFKTAESMHKYMVGELWREYYSLPKDQRKAYLDAHPELPRNPTPTTQAEWDALRSLIKKRAVAAMGRLPNFEATRQANLAEIKASVRTPFGKQNRIVWKS